MNIDLEKLKAVATIEIEPEPEDQDIIGYYTSMGDPEYYELDRKLELEIQSELEYNEWAWCCVRVTARYAGVEGRDYLGGCSYKDEDDFKKGSYYVDMVNEAVAELATALERVALALEVVRGAK